MIKRIELINFMSHEHTVIEPADGLTVLIGPNNCGKSAVVTALQILCTNPKSTYVLRHGAKQCQVIVHTDSGDKIVWSRKKSGSPTYEINGQTFDRLNRQVPDELHKILRMPVVQADKETYDIHFGTQSSPIFLLGDKEKAAAEFFASSSDAIHLVEMQDLHRTQIRENRSHQKRLQIEKKSLEEKIETLQPIQALSERAVQCQNQHSSILESHATTVQLDAKINELSSATTRAANLSAQHDALASIEPPPTLLPTDRLSPLLESLQSKQQDLEQASDRLGILQALQTPPQVEPVDELSEIVTALTELQTTHQQNQLVHDALEKLSPPPAVEPTDSLASTIERLSLAADKFDHTSAQLQSLNNLAPPPQLHDRLSIARVIDDIESAEAKLLQQNELLRTIEKQKAEVYAQIQSWAQEHPQCPTCGNDLQPDQLIAGGHFHE